MRIGIITLNGNHNYGNRLQLYACSKIYSNLGVEPINLVPDESLYTNGLAIKNVKHFAKALLHKGEEPAPEQLMTTGRLQSFLSFSELIPRKVVDSSEYEMLNEGFDYFSTGSDQVWNPNYCRYREDWYYLQFALPRQRIALAPSIGIETLDKAQRRRLKKGVDGFRYLSVRELRGAELIKSASGRSAKVIADPTLVISSGEWRNVAKPLETPMDPYVFTYLLGADNKSYDEVLEIITSAGEIPIVPLSDRQRHGEPDAGPAEFISLIDNASHVVTDSFHAAVFASILETPLTIVRREGGASMFSRLEQLSRMLGIEHKVYGFPSFDLSRASDYEGVAEAIESERRKFMRYLEACLDA